VDCPVGLILDRDVDLCARDSHGILLLAYFYWVIRSPLSVYPYCSSFSGYPARKMGNLRIFGKESCPSCGLDETRWGGALQRGFSWPSPGHEPGTPTAGSRARPGRGRAGFAIGEGPPAVIRPPKVGSRKPGRSWPGLLTQKRGFARRGGA
jgi:hypothetical protein